MEWKFNEETPIYQQIMDQVKQGIATGWYSAGEKLPSVREMALEAGVNPNTMQKALAELEREGLLYSKRTSGRFVAEKIELTKDLQEELVKGYVEMFLKNMKDLGFGLEEILVLLKKYEEER